MAQRVCIIGGGVRGSKILLPGSAFAAIPQVEIVPGLGI